LKNEAEYTIKPFSLDSFPFMQELFRSAYGRELDKKEFQKKYDTHSLGHEVIGFLAIHCSSGTAAAFYGVFPVQVTLYGKQVLAAQSGDTMTHQEHRKRGLFVELAKLTLEACKKEGIVFVFGQPNANSRHGLIHSLRFVHLDNIIRYDLKHRLRSIPFPKLMLRTGNFNSYLRYAERFLKKRMEPAPADFSNTLPTTMGKVWRNENYLAYKNESGKYFLRFGKVVLWVKLDDVFRIGEISDYSLLDASLLRTIKRTAFLLGYNTISIYLNKSVDLPAFMEAFSMKESEPSCFFYLDEQYYGQNLLLTAADFDTW
jgi:hypothetical protein